MPEATPFNINIPDAALEDLRRRLENTRWPDDFGNEDWGYGANKNYLQELVAYWQDSYDWRKQEQEMNEYDHFKITLDDVPIHFIHVKGKGPNPIPLLISHGFPMTSWDQNKLIKPLTDPEGHGGDPAVSFDVIIPDLPGHAFSSPLRKTGVNFMTTADLWVRLMQDVLGYEKFALHGGDWGSMVSQQIGHKYPQHIIGLNSTMSPQLGLWGGEALPPLEDFEDDEKHLFAINQQSMLEAGSHVGSHLFDPQTQAFALHDSPVGQLAWMVEIRRTWSDCNGDIESRFSKDELITQTMLYWLTETYGTAARFYAEARLDPWIPLDDRKPVVRTPSSLSLPALETYEMPRKRDAEYYDLRQTHYLKAGGHFLAMEEPELIVYELRDFFGKITGRNEGLSGHPKISLTPHAPWEKPRVAHSPMPDADTKRPVHGASQG